MWASVEDRGWCPDLISCADGICRLCSKKPSASEFQSDLLRRLFADMGDVSPDVDELVAQLDERAVDRPDKTELFANASDFPEVAKYQQLVADELRLLDEHLAQVRKILQKPKLEYTTVRAGLCRACACMSE